MALSLIALISLVILSLVELMVMLEPLVLVHIYIPVIQHCVNFYLHIQAVNNGAMIEILVIELYDPVTMDGPVVLLSIYRSPQSPIKELYSELDQVMGKLLVLVT